MGAIPAAPETAGPAPEGYAHLGPGIPGPAQAGAAAHLGMAAPAVHQSGASPLTAFSPAAFSPAAGPPFTEAASPGDPGFAAAAPISPMNTSVNAPVNAAAGAVPSPAPVPLPLSDYPSSEHSVRATPDEVLSRWRPIPLSELEGLDDLDPAGIPDELDNGITS